VRSILGPVFYDFRRAFLRPVVLLLLVLFLAGGIGVTYFAYSSFIVQSLRPSISVLVASEGNITVIRGVILDAYGKLVGRAVLRLIDASREKVIATYSVDGNFTISDYRISGELFKIAREAMALQKPSIQQRPLLLLELELGDFKKNYTGLFYMAPDGSSVVFFYSSGFNSFVPGEVLEQIYSRQAYRPGLGGVTVVASSISPGVMAGFHLYLLSKKTGEAKLVVYCFDARSPLRPVRARLFYNVTKSRGLPGAGFLPEKPGKLSYYELGSLSYYFRVYQLRLDPEKDLLVLKLSAGEGGRQSVLYGFTNYGVMVPVESRYVGILASSGGGGLRLFLEFFPIAFLYLAYVFMARPRTTGALEFVLARPVTRWDVYLTRFLAGIAAILVFSGVAVAAIIAGNQFLLGVGLDAGSAATLYLGLVAALAGFYSLCYMFSAALRSGAYLAASIASYLLFSLFWSLIVVVYTFTSGGGFTDVSRNSYLLDYFNPLGAFSYAVYYIQLGYGLTAEISTVNIVAVVASSIAWILGPFTVGYYFFRKAVLTG